MSVVSANSCKSRRFQTTHSSRIYFEQNAKPRGTSLKAWKLVEPRLVDGMRHLGHLMEGQARKNPSQGQEVAEVCRRMGIVLDLDLGQDWRCGSSFFLK